MAEVVDSTGGNPIPIGESMGLMGHIHNWMDRSSLVFYRQGLQGFAAALVSTAILMFILGVNVSTMGLVDIPTTGWVLVLRVLRLPGRSRRELRAQPSLHRKGVAEVETNRADAVTIGWLPSPAVEWILAGYAVK